MLLNICSQYSNELEYLGKVTYNILSFSDKICDRETNLAVRFLQYSSCCQYDLAIAANKTTSPINIHYSLFFLKAENMTVNFTQLCHFSTRVSGAYVDSVLCHFSCYLRLLPSNITMSGINPVEQCSSLPNYLIE